MDIISKVTGKIRYQTVVSLRTLSRLIDHLAYRIESARFLAKREREVLQRNRHFMQCHRGRRAFVIGNGPSINSQDLSLLKNEVTFTCNAFYLNPTLSQWQPTYHSHIDPRAFDGSTKMESWFRETHQKMPDTIFFVPYSAKGTIIEKKFFVPERTYYCSFSGQLCVGVKSVDITKPVPGVESVSLFGICLAIYMGCDPIYLIGMDHDYLAARDIGTHFYKGMEISGAAVSFDRSQTPYDSMIRNILRFWEGYKNLKKFAQSNEINIYNATNGGFLDVFERVKYESLFNRKAVLSAY